MGGWGGYGMVWWYGLDSRPLCLAVEHLRFPQSAPWSGAEVIPEKARTLNLLSMKIYCAQNDPIYPEKMGVRSSLEMRGWEVYGMVRCTAWTLGLFACRWVTPTWCKPCGNARCLQQINQMCPGVSCGSLDTWADQAGRISDREGSEICPPCDTEWHLPEL